MVIVDTGSTMGPAQERLATGLYDLMGYLINPDPEDPEQDYHGIEFLHMGFFSANLTVRETDDSSGEIQAELLTDTDCATEDLHYGLGPDDAPKVGDVAACMAMRGVGDVETNRTLDVMAHIFGEAGYAYGMESLSPYVHPDANCREAGAAACNDGEDNDGNGRWDCEDTSRRLSATLPHHPEPACCPMSVDAEGRCVVNREVVEATCGESEWRNIGACLFHQAMLKCR